MQTDKHKVSIFLKRVLPMVRNIVGLLRYRLPPLMATTVTWYCVPGSRFLRVMKLEFPATTSDVL